MPLVEIMGWSRNRFYGDRADVYYAQGYAMFDFLIRGPEERPTGWDPAWDDLLATYCATMREQKNPSNAVDAAFRSVDWDRLTRAWIQWVKDY